MQTHNSEKENPVRGTKPLQARLLVNFVKSFDKLATKPDYQPARLYAPKRGTWLFVWYNTNPETGELERVESQENLLDQH